MLLLLGQQIYLVPACCVVRFSKEAAGAHLAPAENIIYVFRSVGEKTLPRLFLDLLSSISNGLYEELFFSFI